MHGLILTLHILVSLTLIVIVLIQMSKGNAMGGIFGAGSSDALFSTPSGNVFMKKVTVGLAIAFFCTTILLTLLQSRRGGRSVFQRAGAGQSQGQ